MEKFTFQVDIKIYFSKICLENVTVALRQEFERVRRAEAYLRFEAKFEWEGVDPQCPDGDSLVELSSAVPVVPLPAPHVPPHCPLPPKSTNTAQNRLVSLDQKSGQKSKKNEQ